MPWVVKATTTPLLRDRPGPGVSSSELTRQRCAMLALWRPRLQRRDPGTTSRFAFSARHTRHGPRSMNHGRLPQSTRCHPVGQST